MVSHSSDDGPFVDHELISSVFAQGSVAHHLTGTALQRARLPAHGILNGSDACPSAFLQIVALQACHYLVLCLITPPLLYLFADPVSLSLEGGPSNVAMVMDWRELVGKATIEEKVGDYTRLPPSLGRQQSGWRAPGRHHDIWNTGKNGSETESQMLEQLSLQQEMGQYAAADPVRGWVLGAAWMMASSAEYVT